MSVIINSIGFVPQFSTNSVNWLLGNKLEKVVATLDVSAYWAVGASPNGFVFAVAAGDDYIVSNGPNFVNSGFKIGDTIVITGTVSNNVTRTISAFDNTGLQMYVTGGALVNETSTSAVITGTTLCTGINLRFNLIENASADTFNSLVDNNELKFSLGTADYTNVAYQAMVQQGLFNSNHLGSARVKGYDGVTKNRFIIEHTFYIIPCFLTPELADLIAGISPAYLKDANSLTYLYNVEMLFLINDPNKVHTSGNLRKIGNVGNFNENFNQGLHRFVQNPATFIVNGLASAYADFQQTTDFTIVVTSTNPIFSAGNTKALISHYFLPELDTNYQNTTTNFRENFGFDQAFMTEGAAVINGDNFGLTSQVLKSCKFVRNSATQITVTGQIVLSSQMKVAISALTNKQFCLHITTQDYTKQTEVGDNDKETLWSNTIDVYDTNLTNPNVGNVATDFFFHPSIVTPVGYAGMFVEDAVIGRSSFWIDTTQSPTILSASVIIKAVKGVGSFVIEKKDFSFAGAVLQNGVQQININQTRGFKLKTGNAFNEVSLIRDTAKDIGTKYYYQLLYSFKIRWEDFIQLLGVDPAFYDITKLFNGFNNDWNRFFTLSGWSIEYDVKVYVDSNKFINTLSSSNVVNAYKYDDATDWSTAAFTIKDSNNVSTANTILLNDTMTITADFTKLSGANPALANVVGIIEIEPYQAGGIFVIKQTSSVWQYETGSPFISTVGGDLLEVTNPSAGVYRLTTKLNGALLPLGTQFKISARIYDTSVPPLNGASKQFQDGQGFDFQDSTQYDFQS